MLCGPKELKLFFPQTLLQAPYRPVSGRWPGGWARPARGSGDSGSVQCLREGSTLKIENCPSEGHPSGAPRTGIQCLKLVERSISYAKIGIILQNEVTFYLF